MYVNYEFAEIAINWQFVDRPISGPIRLNTQKFLASAVIIAPDEIMENQLLKLLASYPKIVIKGVSNYTPSCIFVVKLGLLDKKKQKECLEKILDYLKILNIYLSSLPLVIYLSIIPFIEVNLAETSDLLIKVEKEGTIIEHVEYYIAQVEEEIKAFQEQYSFLIERKKKGEAVPDSDIKYLLEGIDALKTFKKQLENFPETVTEEIVKDVELKVKKFFEQVKNL